MTGHGAGTPCTTTSVRNAATKSHGAITGPYRSSRNNDRPVGGVHGVMPSGPSGSMKLTRSSAT